MQAKRLSRALLLINPKAKQGQACYSQAVALLKEHGFDLLEPPTEQIGNLSTFISEAKNKVDLVIVGGGDGSLNAALQGIVATQLPLGVLPLGTANSFARTLGIPLDLIGACQAIATGSIQRIDLGCVNGHYFLNTASLGLSVEITEDVDSAAKRRWGFWVYIVKSLRAFWGAQPFKFQLDDGQTLIESKTFQIVVGNGYYFGGGMIVAPSSSIKNQKLHFTSIEVRHWIQLFGLSLAARRGRHIFHRNVRSFYCDRLSLQTIDSMPVNTDGESATRTPAHFEIKPQALPVIVPRASEAEHS